MAQVHNFELMGLGVEQSPALLLLLGTFPVVVAPPVVKPTIISPTATDITDTTVTLGANITSLGGGTIISYGVAYSSASPFTTTSITHLGSVATGAFTFAAPGLIPFTVYTYYAFATNEAGTSLTAVGTFTTLPAQNVVGTGQRLTFWGPGDSSRSAKQPAFFAKGAKLGPKG